MAVLAREVERAGVEVTLRHRRARLSHGKAVASRRLGTDRAELVADEYVVCAGFWSQDARARSRHAIPMQAGKGYSLTLETRPRCRSVCAILSEARVAVTPMGGALRFAGTMELSGLDERHQSRARAGHRQLGRALLPRHRAGRQIAAGDRALRPAPLLAGWPALRRPGREIRQSLGRHRARDDGHEPRTDHRQAHLGDPCPASRLRAASKAVSRSLCVGPRNHQRKEQAMKVNWHGVLPAITTPFNADLTRRRGLPRQAFALDGRRGLGGPRSRRLARRIGHADRRREAQGLETCVKAVGDRVPIVPGIAALSTAEAVKLAQDAKAIGCSGLDGAAALRLQHRLARDEGARARRHCRDRPPVHALQQPDRLQDRLPPEAHRRARARAAQPPRRQGIERRPAARDGDPGAGRARADPGRRRRRDRRGDRCRRDRVDRGTRQRLPRRVGRALPLRDGRTEGRGVRRSTSGSCRSCAWTRW